MSWWKRGYENFQIRLLILFAAMFCGRAYALPQDWPCADFLLKEYKIEQYPDSDKNLHYYKGVLNQYELEIVLEESEEQPLRLDDCGTAGCSGMIYNLETKDEELLNFYCEELAENKLENIRCRVHFDSEYLFAKVDKYLYQSPLCVDKKQDFYQLDIRQCERCSCQIAYFYDNIRQQNDMTLNCMRESPESVRCFSLEKYLLKFFPNVSAQDYEDCVGLNL